jgi:hypothetical protein
MLGTHGNARNLGHAIEAETKAEWWDERIKVDREYIDFGSCPVLEACSDADQLAGGGK